MSAPTIGHRTVVAMTCSKCNMLKPGSEFERYVRKTGERVAYITRRCRKCRWRVMESSNGR